VGHGTKFKFGKNRLGASVLVSSIGNIRGSGPDGGPPCLTFKFMS
jgi:hypothetical protein